MPADEAASASLAAARRFMAAIDLCPTPVVALFWSLDGEIDTRPLLQALHALAVPTALPRMQGPAKPLLFHRYQPGDRLEPGPFGVMQPPADAPHVVPQVMLAPLLAFDPAGYRLGWGGGFYDRTIAAARCSGKPVTAVGYAFASQEVDLVPREVFDQRLDLVVTDRATRMIR